MTEKDIQTIQTNLQKDHTAEIEYRKDLENDLNRKIEIANSKMDIVYEDRLAHRISTEKCDTKLAELKQEVQRLTEARTKLQVDTIDYFDFGINLMELARKLKDMWGDATKEEKQELFTLAFSEMKMSDKFLEIEYTPWFAKLKNHMPNLERVCELLNDTDNTTRHYRFSITSRVLAGTIGLVPIL